MLLCTRSRAHFVPLRDERQRGNSAPESPPAIISGCRALTERPSYFAFVSRAPMEERLLRVSSSLAAVWALSSMARMVGRSAGEMAVAQTAPVSRMAALTRGR